MYTIWSFVLRHTNTQPSTSNTYTEELYNLSVHVGYLQYEGQGGRKEGHEDKVVGNERHTTKAANGLKLGHSCTEYTNNK